ncbi:pepsin/retropepsin-like aspartic protease family protein [Gallaecimonas mangrovi]|uniref:aspartyl protease family protein n=1 Tax=Gallaecimonas mangrovi TaxID=2291597 RepID=UPI001867681D|nr:aspartyl protease family protein [Gallaecimonas mangrovi]
MKRCLWLLLSLCLVAVAPASWAKTQVLTLAVNKAGLEVINAKVAGRKGTFLFDSGIGVSGVTPAFAAAIGCTPWGKITGFRAIGARLDVPRCNKAKVSVGRYQTALSPLAVYNLPAFMGKAARGLDGVIGLDVFANKVVTLDVAKHQLLLEDNRSLGRIKKQGIEVPIRLVRSAEGAALTANMGVPVFTGMTWLELDSGNYGPSLLDQTVAGLFGLSKTNPKAQLWSFHPKAKLAVSGPVLVRNLIMDGNLGRQVLKHWQVTLDLAHSRGWVVVNK